MFAQPLDVETGITVERDGFVFTDLTFRRRPIQKNREIGTGERRKV
jgi:hypothetical protein